MRLSRIAAKSPLLLAMIAALAIGGCDDSPEVPAHVQELARQREEEDQRLSEELARKREARAIRPADEPLVDSPAVDGSTRTATAQNSGTPTVSDAGMPRIGPGDTRVGDVEPPATPTPPVAPRRSAAAKRWDGMKAGMTTNEVASLLGRPTRIALDDLFLDYWYYGQGRTAGRVAFIRGSQKAIAWDPPID